MTNSLRIDTAISTFPSIANAVNRGGYLYTSGVCAVDEKGRVVAPGDLREQAAYVYRKLAEVLKAANVPWSQVVKVNTYVAPEVTSAGDRQLLRDAHKDHIAPGRCAALAAPLPQPVDGCLLQVELIARPDARLRPIVTADVPVASDWAAAVQADETLYVGGRLPLNASVPVDGPTLRVEGDLGEQADALYAHHDRALRAAGVSWSDAVQVHQFMTSRQSRLDAVQRARHRFLSPGSFLSTSVACEANFPDWPLENALILVDMEADTRSRTGVAPANIWGNKPGSHAFWSGPILRMHGQVARGPEARTLHEGDIVGQSELVFRNLDAILRTADADWSDVVHVRSFCKRREDIAAARHVREGYIGTGTCAVTELVADFFDPLLLLEVELVAIRG